MDLTTKLDSTEALNKKLLTEIVQLQQEKVQIEAMFAASSQDKKGLTEKLSQSEKCALEKVLAKEWHFLALVVKETNSLGKKVVSEEMDGLVSSTNNVNCTPGKSRSRSID